MSAVKAKTWNFEAKTNAETIKFGLRAPRGLEDYITEFSFIRWHYFILHN